MSNATVICGDCVDVMQRLDIASIDLVVTSPPYDNLRTYDGYTWDFKATANRLMEVLKPGGVICWIVGDQVIDGSESLTSFKQAIYFKEQCGLRMHDTMIYAKKNCSFPGGVRYHQCAEYIFVLSKGRPRTFNPICDKINTWAGQTSFGIKSHRKRDGSFSNSRRTIYAPLGMRGNVWEGKTRGQEDICEAQDHHAVMPQWLARDLIRSWSNKGDLILDPMAGSGTVGEQAGILERDSILIDISKKSCRLMRRNLKAWEIDGKRIIKVQCQS